MPERETLERAQEDAREGKSPSTQAGEGKHGARSAQQAIAIGLSKARRAGVRLAAPKGPASIRRKVAQDKTAAKEGSTRNTSVTRSRAAQGALKRESRSAASHRALSRHAKKVAAQRGKQGRRPAA
jgi:hypothetical protein